MATLALLSLFKTFYLIFKYGNCKQQQNAYSYPAVETIILAEENK